MRSTYIQFRLHQQPDSQEPDACSQPIDPESTANRKGGNELVVCGQRTHTTPGLDYRQPIHPWAATRQANPPAHKAGGTWPTKKFQGGWGMSPILTKHLN